MSYLKVATLNVQGCKDKTERINIAKDAKKYGINIMGLTETHMEEEEKENITVGNTSYNIYHNGINNKNKYTGVGLLINAEIKTDFKKISDRICVAEIDLNIQKKIIVIVAYAPTLVVSEKQPSEREDFYNKLSEITRKTNKNRHIIITLGDFNAKTGSGHRNFPEVVGKYGKGHINSNGEYLITYAK